jgi:hypothetical protein
MNYYLARYISNIFNPFLVSFAVIAVLAFESAPGTVEAVKWLVISIALSVLPVFAFVVYMVRVKKLDGIFINPRKQRTSIYVLATCLSAAGVTVLYFVQAPELLSVTFVTGLVSIIAFMSINLYWKISLHTGFIAAAAVIIIIVYGAIASFVLLLVPLVGWARLEMKLHSWPQVASGALLAAGIAAAIFTAFGISGN